MLTSSIYNFTLANYKPIIAVKGTWIDGESLNVVLHLFIIGSDVSSPGQLTYFLFKQRLGCYLLQVRGDIARALMYMAVCYGFQQPRQAFASRMPQMLVGSTLELLKFSFDNSIWVFSSNPKGEYTCLTFTCVDQIISELSSFLCICLSND